MEDEEEDEEDEEDDEDDEDENSLSLGAELKLPMGRPFLLSSSESSL